MLIRIDRLVPDPGQPRKTFKEETLEELKESVGSLGLINPLTVRPTGDGKYMIIVGERRFRAAKKAGLSEVQCIVREDVDDKIVREMQFAENYHLETLPPMEQARAWYEHMKKYGLSQAALAGRIGIHPSSITYHIAMVERLDSDLVTEVEKERLQYKEAREIAKIPDRERQREVAKPFIKGEVSSVHAQPIVSKARAEPTRPVEDIVDEVVYGVKHVPKEELELAKPPETMLDIGFKLEEKILDLSQMLTAYDLSRIPAGQRQALIGALKILADKIELALEFLTGKKRREIEGVIEGEVRQIDT